MSRHVRIEGLHEAIDRELEIYSEAVNQGIIKCTKSAMRDLVNKTKATAPVGKRHGAYRDNITSDTSKLKGSAKTGRDFSATWYVKAPDYRLTHLLVNGHEKKNGGRTRPDPFLKDAVDSVIPEYEQKIEEVVKNGG